MSLFKEAIYNNRWLWAHVFLGGVLAKILSYFLVPQLVIAAVLIIAVLYEIYQWITGEHRNFLDAVGDISGALAMATVVLL